jgi:hypothetical protein
MNRPDRSRLDDPTAEAVADQSTQSASGLGSSRGREGTEKNRTGDDDTVRRTADERDYTPRRYEQPAEDDPVMPSDDSTLQTKI